MSGQSALYLLFYPLERALFDSGDLRLRDAYLVGNLHLSFAAVEAQGDDFLFALGELFHRLGKGNALKSAFIAVVFVLYLVHHIDGIAAVVAVDWVVERYGSHYRVERIGNVLFALAGFLGDILYRRLA